MQDLHGMHGCTRHARSYLLQARQPVRAALSTVKSLAELDDLLAMINVNQQANREVMSAPRGRTGNPRPTALPDRWLDSRHITEADGHIVAQAELAVSGG